MARVLALLVLLCLIGCSAPPPAASPGGETPSKASVEAPAAPSNLTPPPEPDLVSPAAVALIVRWEIGTRDLYNRRYQGIICPGAASGPTWGIGYDGGHQARATIESDWKAHEHVAALATSSGVRGDAACAAFKGRHAYITTPWDYAYDVFASVSLVEYYRRARRAFPGMEHLRPNAQGALVSLVYNRGTSMTGDSRREMRAIRDECVPARDYECIAHQIRAMTRIWKNSSIEAGMTRRRNDEADLVLTP